MYMKKEIEELKSIIENNEKFIDKLRNMNNYYENEIVKLKIELNYVKNKKLQEENIILKENAIYNDKVVDKARWNEMIYKSRNKKAIEYIMTELITEWDIKNDGYVSGSDLPVDAITPLLNILKGDNKDE